MSSSPSQPFASIPAPTALVAALLILTLPLPAWCADDASPADEPRSEQSATNLPAPAPAPAGQEAVLTLDELVGTALKHNKGIEAARQRVAQSAGELTQARAAYLPQVEIAGTYSYVHRKDVTSLLTEEGGVVAPTPTARPRSRSSCTTSAGRAAPSPPNGRTAMPPRPPCASR